MTFFFFFCPGEREETPVHTYFSSYFMTFFKYNQLNIATKVPFVCFLGDAPPCHEQELLLVLFSVAFLGEHLGGRSCLGFSVTMVGVGLYKLVPKRSPQGNADYLLSCVKVHDVGVRGVDAF